MSSAMTSRRTTANILGLCLMAGALAVPTLYGCGGGAKPAQTVGGEPTEGSTAASAIPTTSAAPAESAAADSSNDTRRRWPRC